MIVVDVPALLERLGIEITKRTSGGREIWACCPLPGHEERTPSWQIHDEPDDDRHARWRCLGACHEGGGPVGLVMRLCGFQRASEARAWIKSGATFDRATRFERVLSEDRLLRLGAPSDGLPAFRLPQGVRFAPLSEWPSTPRQYLLSRGLTEHEVDAWGIGYAVDGRLSGRVVLPWRDQCGRLGGYTGRSYVPGEPKKHLEPAEKEGAAHGWVYGEERWPEVPERVGVVEGAFDGLAIARACGIPFAAARGSNLHPGHVARISSFPVVYVFSNPDAANDAFVERIGAAISRHCDVRRVSLPAGYDPAKLERRDPDKLVDLFVRAV